MAAEDPTYSRLLRTLKQVRPHEHLCHIYETRQEQVAATASFLEWGLERGERCFCLVEEGTGRMVADAMRGSGLQVDRAMQSGSLTISGWHDSYCSGGYFSPGKMIDFLARETGVARKAGFPGFRLVGEMNWQLICDPGPTGLIEYEAQLNEFLREQNACILCQYDRSRFAPKRILEVMRTHPTVLFGGRVCRNPYYVPPKDLLQPGRWEQEVDRHLAYILDRQQASDHLAFLASLLENVSDAVLATDEQFGIVSWNRGAEEIYGWAAEDVLGRQHQAVLHSEYTGLSPDEAMQLLRERGRLEIQALQRRKDGQPVWVEAKAISLRDESGTVTGYVSVNRDISERKRAEEAIIRLDRLKNEFVSAAAHELRTPLTAIMGFSEVLSTPEFHESLSEPERLALLAEIQEKGDLLTRIIDDLLDVSRLEQGAEMNIRPREAELEPLVRRTVEHFDRNDPGRDFVFESCLPEDASYVFDPARLLQVLEHLLDNATKYSPPGSPVLTGVEEKEGRLLITITDRGGGLLPEDLERIFQKFYRVDSSYISPSGLGIGLYLCRWIVEAMGGRIWAETEPGQRTTFRLWLPSLPAAGR